MRRSFLVAVAATLVAAAAVMTTAGAGREASAAARQTTAPARIDVSSRASIDKYLRSIGVNPKGVVIQRGARNYAGPKCPGKAWNCTNARKVVQIDTRKRAARSGARTLASSSDDDDDEEDGGNLFVCSPAAAGTNAATNTCVFAQVSSSNRNRAQCTVRDSAPQGKIEQACVGTQQNSSGTNEFVGEMSIVMRSNAPAGGVQRGQQRAEVTQTNGSGANISRLTQKIRLLLSSVRFGPISQSQESEQDADINQSSNTGSNWNWTSQFLDTEAVAFGAILIEQCQNGDEATSAFNGACTPLTSPADVALADIDQVSSTGRNTNTLIQDQEYLGRANRGDDDDDDDDGDDEGDDDDGDDGDEDGGGFPDADVHQTQGTELRDIEGIVNQDSDSPSKNFSASAERELQVLFAPDAPTTIQTQDPREFCCTTQFPGGRATIDQRFTQFADPGPQPPPEIGVQQYEGAESRQTIVQVATCNSPTGPGCTATQTARQNDASSSQTFTGNVFTMTNGCVGAAGVNECTAVPPEEDPYDPYGPVLAGGPSG